MNSRQRMLAALRNDPPDRLPATTHHVMAYFLDTTMDGASSREFFDHFGLDAVHWVSPYTPDEAQGETYDPNQGGVDGLDPRWIVSDEWRVVTERIPNARYDTIRYRFATPRGELSMVTQSDQYTSWVTERPIKRKGDIDLIGEFVTAPKCDVEAVNREAAAFGERGLVRSHICCFDVYGQPGTWQDAACLVGTEALILATYDDAEWVHELLRILQRRKLVYVDSLKGAAYDILELGGGDGSTTVISPRIFEEFVAPYDRELIARAHEAGQRIVYHTCGGMMPILEMIVDMGPDAIETLTPPDMGGDVDLKEAKERVGDRVCLIGGFDQFHFLVGCTPEETRAEVRRCFEAAGDGGGFILSPSDHFFDAEPELLAAFADEARRCVY